jgi:hypothetical protein
LWNPLFGEEVTIMKRMHHKYGALTILVLALLLGLLLAAGPAMATTTTVNTTQAVMMGILDFGTSWTYSNDALHTDDFVIYSMTYRATGPDGSRALGYVVVCMDVIEPLKGDNYHEGDVAILPLFKANGVDNDPADWWDEDESFSDNLAGHDLLWTGSWDGYTLNKRNHKAIVDLVAPDGSANDGYTAHAVLNSGGFDQANYHSDRFVGVPWNALYYITEL